METPWESMALPKSASLANVMAIWTRMLSATVTAGQGSVGSAWITAPAPSVRTVKMDTTTVTPQSHVRVWKNNYNGYKPEYTTRSHYQLVTYLRLVRTHWRHFLMHRDILLASLFNMQGPPLGLYLFKEMENTARRKIMLKGYSVRQKVMPKSPDKASICDELGVRIKKWNAKSIIVKVPSVLLFSPCSL